MKKSRRIVSCGLAFSIIISTVLGSLFFNSRNVYAWGADSVKRYLINTLYTNIHDDTVADWSDSEFQTIINKSITAGYNTVMINAPWKTLQPYNTGNETTDFDWSVLDKWMDYVIGSTSLNTIIALDYTCFALPLWLDDTDSSSYLAVKPDRQVYREFRGGYPRDPALTLNSTYVRQLVDRYTRKLVEHVKNRYSLNLSRILAFQVAWTPSEENNYMDDTDYSDADQEAFRTWLQNRYATISSLNSIWKTNYASFNEIYLGHYPYQKDVDMQKFRQDTLYSFLKVVHDAGHAVDSGFKLAVRQGGIVGTADSGIVDHAYFSDIVDWWFTDNMQNRYPNTEVIYDYFTTVARLNSTLWGDEGDPLEMLFNNGWTYPLPGADVQNPYYRDRGQFIYNHGGNSLDMAHWNEINGRSGATNELAPANWYDTSIWTFQSTLGSMAASNVVRNSNSRAIYYSPWTNIKDAVDVRPEPLMTKITNDTVEWNLIKAKRDALGVSCDIISDELITGSNKTRLLSYTDGIYVPQATYMTQAAKEALQFAYANGIPVYVDNVSEAGMCDEYGNPSKTLYRTLVENNANIPYVQRIEDGNSQAKIFFNTVTGATSYKIKYGTVSGGYTSTATATSSPYVLSGLTNGAKYYFTVTTVVNNNEIGTTAECNTVPSDATLLFRDDFSNGRVEWSDYAGDWKVENEEFSQSQTDLNNKRSNLINKKLSNFTLRFRSKIIDNGGNPQNWTGVLLRSQNPGDTFSDSGYLFYVRDNGNAAIYRQGVGDIATAVNVANIHNSFADFRVVVNNGNIKVYVNGAASPVMDINDSTYSSGYVSLITGNTHSHYDDIYLHSVVSGDDTTLPDAISDVNVVDRGNSYTLLKWTATGDDGSTGKASAYDVRYSTSPITSSNWNNASMALGTIIPSVPGTVEYMKIDNLFPKGGKLYFSVKAADEKLNWSSPSNSPANDVEIYKASEGYNISTQGLNGWKFRQFKDSVFSDMVFNSSMNQWQGSETFVLVGQDNQHPGSSYDSVRTWVAPHSGTLSIRSNGNIRLGSSSSNGVNVKIMKNGLTQVWPAAGWVGISNIAGVDFGILNDVVVSEGDTLDFIVNSAGSNSNDTTYWDPVIVYYGINTNETLNPSPVGDLSAVCTLNDSVILHWTSPGDDYSNGTASKYDIRYSSSPIDDANWSSSIQVINITEPQTSGRVESFTVKGINEDTDYFFAMKTRDENNNWSLISNVVGLRTRPVAKYYSVHDFGRIQGGNAWRYQQNDNINYRDLSYFDIPNNRWRRDDSLNLVGPDWQWPGGSMNSVRVWTAPASGTIKIASDGNIKLNYSSGTDGTRVKVMKNSIQIWPAAGWQSINDTSGVDMGVLSDIVVSQGDRIYFMVDKNINNNYDSTTWKPVITYTSGGPAVKVHRASTGFSRTQGELKWNYEDSNNGILNWDSTNSRWFSASDAFCIVGPNWQHPGSTLDSVRKWTSPSSGTVTVTGNISVASGGDGVRVEVMKNGTQIWPSSGWYSVAGGSSLSMNFNVSVAANDVIKFVVNCNGNNTNDTTTWDPVITFN